MIRDPRKMPGFHRMTTPFMLLDEGLLIRNLEILAGVARRTGCKVLLAQKGFSMFAEYPLIGRYLSGTTASSLHEARLGKEEMGGETHIFAAAYREDEFAEIVKICEHIVFNTPEQLERFGSKAHGVSLGLRLNPEYSEVETLLYNPCAAGSRMGTTRENLLKALERNPSLLEGLDGFHFHTLCEQNADALAHTLPHLEERFGMFIKGKKWLNFGGGHHITREDYDIELLCRCITHMQEKYGLTVYLEPGEAVALNTGYLVASVLEIMNNGIDIAILDTSAACHMPDVLEMPYRPGIIGAKEPNELPYTYRLAGPTCLSGDVIGDYSFPEALKYGDKLVFLDMAHYTMVKNNTFNGINLPDIALWREGDDKITTVKRFGYSDFKSRLS